MEAMKLKSEKTKREIEIPETSPHLCTCPMFLSFFNSGKEEEGEEGGSISIAKVNPDPGHHLTSEPPLVNFTCPMDPPHQSLFPFTFTRQDFCPSFSLAIVDGNLYCVGGASPTSTTVPRGFIMRRDKENEFGASDDVFKLDEAHCVWKPLPSMSTPRYRPSVLTHNGKIYAFGCALSPLAILKCFAEVYDTKCPHGQWEPYIPTVTRYINDCVTAVVSCSFFDDYNKLLIVFPLENHAIIISLSSGSSPSHTLAPSSALNSVTSSPSPFVPPGRSNFVVVDNILFVFPLWSSHLIAIRLQNDNITQNDSENSVFEVEGSDIIIRTLGQPVSHPSFLFHTGQMRFLLVSANFVRIFYSWFRVVNNCKNLRVELDGQSSYPHNSMLFDATMQCNCQVNLIEKEKEAKAQPLVIGTPAVLEAADENEKGDLDLDLDGLNELGIKSDESSKTLNSGLEIIGMC